jgi:hypothetical protein
MPVAVPEPSRSDEFPAIRPAIDVAVVMRRERINNPWQTWRWVLAEVVATEAGFGDKPARLLHTADEERWLFPGFRVELLASDAEGYYLNATTAQPCFWVVWRLEETAAIAEEPLAVPQVVTLSYHDAGRWLDAQETVEQVPAPPDVIAWLQAFVKAHHVPEVKRRQRPQSFESLQDRFGNPARISTDKFKGGGHGG